MQILEGRALKLRLRNPARVTSVIPKSTVIDTDSAGRSQVLVHWGLDEAIILKNLGFTMVPSPIIGRYKWPGIYHPMDHQRVTSSFLTLHKRAYCFNEQGTGKTLSVAWAADYLMELARIKRVLVICPVSTMQTSWQSDLFRSVMHRTVGIAHGTREKRIRVINSSAEFVIINPDGVNTVAKELRAAKFDLIVVDEATCVKTASTTRWRAINSLVTPSTWVWMLTGTPAAQSPMDAYGLARMMDRATAPATESSWRDEVMIKVTQFKWVPRMGSKELVFNLLQPAIRFSKEECLDLPELLMVTREVELTRHQKSAYESIRKYLAVAAQGAVITAVNAASGMSKLMQISSGSAYTDDGVTLDFDMQPRYKELRSVIDESSHKVLVFVPYTNMVDRLHEMLNADGYTAEIIDGRVSARNRADIITRFQRDPEPQVLVLQPQAVSHGVTLHAANTSVWWGPVTSYETYAQANARMYRKGQRNACLVVNLQGSPVEKLRYEALASMSKDQTSLLGMYEEVLKLTM